MNDTFDHLPLRLKRNTERHRSVEALSCYEDDWIGAVSISFSMHSEALHVMSLSLKLYHFEIFNNKILLLKSQSNHAFLHYGDLQQLLSVLVHK